jgi:spermidine/putrescine-binding protein
MEDPPVPRRLAAARTSTVLASLSLVLAACGQAAEPNELLVLEWAGYEEEDFWTDFASANPDTDVSFEFGTNDADILAQMQAGSQADVFHFYTGWQQFYVDEELVQEIDTSQLTNWDKVPDSFKELGQIDGVQYFIPWDWGFTSILYNTEQVPEVTSWDVLLNEEYAGHISMWDDGPAAVTVSSYINGWDERSTRTCAPKSSAATSGSPTPGRAATRRPSTRACRSRMPIRKRAATAGSACTASAPRRTATSWRSSSLTSSWRSWPAETP